MLRALARAALDRVAPTTAQYYRDIRNAKAADLEAQRFLPTTFGFSLTGHPYLMDGTWELEETKVFLRQLDEAEGCIDIGANVGFYSCLAASRRKPVIAVEPLPSNLKLLYANLIHNGYGDVEVYPLGLASKPELQRLYGAARVASFVKGWAEAVESRFTVVPTTTLDLLLGGRFSGAPLVIKMDVEGFELAVLGGAEKTLNRDPKPTWLVEILLNDRAVPGRINQTFWQTFDVFWQHGYKAVHVVRDVVLEPEEVHRWAEQRSIDGPPNFLFVGS